MKKLRMFVAATSASAMLAVSSMAALPSAAQAAEAGLYNGAPIVLADARGPIWKKRYYGKRHYSKRYHRHNHRHYHRHYHRRGSNIGVGIAGFALGAMVGSAVSQPRYYRGSNWDAYCASKYRSYKPRTGTYTTYDGREVPCR